MLDFVQHVIDESDRFNRALSSMVAEGGTETLGSTSVPSCPDWSAADLVWHLAEVQYFWASIVDGNLAEPSGVQPLRRPGDDELLALHAQEAARLASALAAHDADEPCWSWYTPDQRVGWVRRRQAHEALIHRVDAELVADTITGSARTPLHEDLSADGIDEMLQVMLDAGPLEPGWQFEVDEATARIDVPGRSWTMNLQTLSTVDDQGARRHDEAVKLIEPVESPSVVIAGPASHLNTWLWHRGNLAQASIQGDRSVAERIFAMSAME